MSVGNGVSSALGHLNDAGRSSRRWAAMVLAFVGAGALAACMQREGLSDRSSWLSWAVAPLLPASSADRGSPGTVEAAGQIEPANGPAPPVMTSGDALPDPGFVLIGPTSPLAVEPDPAAVEMVQQIQSWLWQLVSRGFMQEIFVDRTRNAHANPVVHYFVQIGSHHDIRLAERQLAAARARFDAVFGGIQTRIQSVDLAERGRFFRAHIGPFASAAGARALCNTLMQQRQDCIAVAEHRASPPGPTARPDRAKIAVGEGRTRVDLAEAGRGDSSLYTDKPRFRDLEQRADALPLFTAPGLPGVPD